VKTAKTSKGEEDKEAKRRLQQLMQQYQQLRDHLDPLGAVTREWAEAEKILNEALKANIVDQKTYNDLIEAAATYYTEAAYPVTQLRKEIERQTELLGHEIGQREILDTIYQKEKEMRRTLTEVERESIAVALEHFQTKEKEVRLYEELQQPYTQHAERLKYLETLYEKGKISTEQYTKALNETALAMLDLDKSASGGLSRGIIRLQDEFTDLASVVEQGLMNAFRGAEDALVSFVQTGKVDFKKLIDSMIADLIRLAVRQQIMSFAVNALGGMATGGTAAPITVATPVAPRALGGPVMGGQTYSINERRQPEMLSVGGKDYLTMGSESGRVTPLQPGGRGGAVTVVVEPVIYNNASDSVQATTETQQDENGNVSMTVMINKIEQGIAGNVQSGNSPLLKSMGAALGVTPKPRGR
jgi:lambda family phage tail tape measure protein